MRCPSCEHHVGDEARFCERCGVSLATICNVCGAAASQAARFCWACGVTLAAGGVTPQDADVTDAVERRQVTILFCDMVDSTALAGSVDPEELRELIRSYYEICAREVGRMGGYIARYVGDGVVVYFGYPLAREQDAQAAVLAGLALAKAVQASDKRLAVRVGIHSGLVVAGGGVGGPDRRELLVVGSTPNVSARLQMLAPPNGVVISDETYDLVRGFFDCRDLGPRELKGVATPVRVWEVRGETNAQSRVEGAERAGLTPLVARDRELATLLECWRGTTEGRGRLVLVCGDAGLGKSRLLFELKRQLVGAPYVRFECRCSPHNESSALFPILDLLRRTWDLRREDSAEERLARLEAAAAPHVASLPDAIPLLAALLSVPLSKGYSPSELSPQARKQRTLALLVSILTGIAERQPVLFVVEDVHWIDPSTLELLHLIVERLPALRLMVMLLFRPTFDAPWGAGGTVLRIDVGRLESKESLTLVERVAGGMALPEEVAHDICARADGVPLYLEELTKTVLESGAFRAVDGRYELVRPLTPVAVPMSLTDSLMARLDRLAPLKDVVQLGATIGRAFAWELVLAVSELDDVTLERELDRLVRAEVLHRHGTPPNATYVFKHALIQDAAYESLPKLRRRTYHRRIAECLEQQFPDVVTTQPELLGHHWAGAGRTAEAITYSLRAGQQAYERSAYVEAANHLERGLALLDGLADPVERGRRELELRLALGAVLVGTRGYSNADVEATYARARELCEQVGGDARLRYAVLSGLLLFHQSRAELATCVDLTEQRLKLARELHDPSLEMLVHENFGTLAYWRGEFAAALVSLREARALYTPEGGRALRLVYGTDTAVVTTTYESQCLFFLGYPDQAERKALESIAIARELGQGHSLVLALAFAGTLHLLRGEAHDAETLLEEAHRLAVEQQLPQWIGSCAVVRADAQVALGRPEEGITGFLAGLAAFQATGATIAGRFFIARFAEAYLASGRPAEGLSLLENVLPLLSRCEDVFYDPEVARIRGRLLLAIAPAEPGQAEKCFVEARELACRHESKSLELRAATSLAELWRTRGRREEAHDLLAELYGWFSEGFATRDLREAAALLAALTDQPAAPGFTARTSTYSTRPSR